MDDREILELYNARSESAIARTDEKYGGYCRAIAFQILSDKQDTEECVNDTYYRAWNLIPPNCPPCLKTFLGRITRRLSFHMFEKRLAAKRGGGELPLVLDELSECVPAVQDTENTVDAMLLAETVNAFLKQLSVEERYIFVHRCWYVEPMREIADSLGITENYTKVLLHRTRQKLKRVLEKEGIMV